MMYRLRARDPRFDDACQYEFDTYEEAAAARLFVRKYGVYLEDVTPALCEIEYRTSDDGPWLPIPKPSQEIHWAADLAREYQEKLMSRWN